MDNEFRMRRIARRVIYSWPVVALAGIITLWLGFSTARLYVQQRPLSQASKALEADVVAADTQTRALEERVRRLQTPAGVEEEVRDRFQVRRPDERVLVIVREQEEEQRVPARSALSFSRMFALVRGWLGF